MRTLAAIWRAVGSVTPTLGGAVGFLLLWEVVGQAGILGRSFPPLTQIATAFEGEVASSLLLRSLARTSTSALIALGIGSAVALLIAVASALVPRLRRGLDSLASSIYAIPTIAFGPVLILVAGPETTPIVLGVLSAYFPIFVALSSELRFAPPAYADLSATFGASRSNAFVRVAFPHAIPAFVDGLRLGAPGAVLGVILGEWFGAPRGIGVLILSSLQNFRIAQLWAAAFLGVAISFAAYAALTILHRATQRRFAW